MKRIPYDSEIIYFLKHWVNLTPDSFVEQKEKENFVILLTRIHDCCCQLVHGIKKKILFFQAGIDRGLGN